MLWVGACIGLGLWEISNTFAQFFLFDVKTKTEITEAKVDGIPFPAITFCHISLGRKSVLGGSPSETVGLMTLLTL